jgi:hypothetical protein
LCLFVFSSLTGSVGCGFFLRLLGGLLLCCLSSRFFLRLFCSFLFRRFGSGLLFRFLGGFFLLRFLVLLS